jgi:predicted PurR-regulated permease PerM
LIPLAAALVILLAVRQIASALLAPLLLAVFLFTLLVPILNWLRRHGLSSLWAVVVIVTSIVLLGWALVSLIGWSVGLVEGNLATYIAQIVQNLRRTLEMTGVNPTAATEAVQSRGAQVALAILQFIARNVGNLTVYFVTVPLLVVFLLLQAEQWPEMAARAWPQGSRYLARIEKFSDTILFYIWGRTKVNAATALGVTVVFFILGVDLAPLWGALVFFLSYIPYIGLFVAGIPPVLLAFAENGPWVALFAIIGIFAANVLAENVLEPMIIGRGLRLPMAVVFIAFFFWSWLLGFVGSLLSVPLTVLMKIVLEDYEETRWISALMEGHYEPPKGIRLPWFRT